MYTQSELPRGKKGKRITEDFRGRFFGTGQKRQEPEGAQGKGENTQGTTSKRRLKRLKDSKTEAAGRDGWTGSKRI